MTALTPRCYEVQGFAFKRLQNPDDLSKLISLVSDSFLHAPAKNKRQSSFQCKPGQPSLLPVGSCNLGHALADRGALEGSIAQRGWHGPDRSVEDFSPYSTRKTTANISSQQAFSIKGRV